MQEALEAQKEEHSRREEAFRRREEALRKKDLDLQDSLIRFNKFLRVSHSTGAHVWCLSSSQENEAKRHRAEKRAADEQKARFAKEKEIKELNEKLMALRAESQEMDDLVQKSADA